MVKELVETYFNSWQEPADFGQTASCLHDDITVDMGFFKTDDKAAFIGMMSHNPVPWKDVNLLYSKYSENFACIVYEGINTANDQKMRVSEAIEIKEDKITSIFAVIAQLP